MRVHRLETPLLFMAIIIALCSCTPNTKNTFTRTVSTESPTVTLVETTPIPSVTATSSSLQPTNETAWAAATSVPTQANEEPSPKVCTLPPQQFNIGDVLNMSLLNLRFENENRLTFEGWTSGPEPIITPVTPEPTPDMFPGPYIYTRRLLTSGQLNLLNGQLSIHTPDFEPLLNNPCGEDCPLEIIGQSPNREWQLVQVHDWLVDVSGIWLVSKSEMIQLIPYIAYLKWQWAADNSLLWIVYSDPEVGGYTLVAQLGSPVIVRNTVFGTEELPFQLDPWSHIVAFSPIDKIAISTTSFEFASDDTDELFTINLTDTFTVTEPSKIVPDIVTVNWNEGTQSFLLEIVRESGVEIQDLSGDTLLIIPRSTIELFYKIPTDKSLPSYFRIGDDYALSPSGARFAVVQGSNLLVFECEDLIGP